MKMSKMKKNRKKLFAILLQAALVSTAMTMPAYAAKTPGIGSDARIGDDATGPVLTGGNTEVEEETSPYTKEQLEDGTLEYGEIAWRIEGYNSRGERPHGRCDGPEVRRYGCGDERAV